MFNSIDTDSVQFLIICALVSIVGYLIIHIHQRIERKIDDLASKVEKYEEQNSKDHGRVSTTLSRLDATVESLRSEMDELKQEVDQLRRDMMLVNRKGL